MSESVLILTELEPGTAEYEAARTVGSKLDSKALAQHALSGEVPPARSVAYWLEHWGGYTGKLHGPDGSTHEVSLERWRDRDPETTYVVIRARWVDSVRLAATRAGPIDEPPRR